MIKKSIFTLILLAAIGCVSAQSLQFELNGTVYADGERIICTYVEEWGEMVQHMQVRNMNNEQVNVLIEKEHVQIVEGTQNSFCWGSCYTPDVFVSPRPVTLEANAVSNENDLSFHHQIDPEYSGDPSNFIAGTSIVKYYAYPEFAQDQKVCIEVWFAYNADDVAENHVVNFSHAYPNPASSVVKFNYEIGSNCNVVACIYNLLGQEVMRKELNNLQGQLSFSVAELNEGIYFCNLMVNGQALKTEKFIVKK